MAVRLFSFTYFFTVSLSMAFSQTVIEGKLLKTRDGAPIAYANIGIVNTPVGTISNADGTFEIRIPEKYTRDTLLFAALGYQRKSFPVKSLDGKRDLVVFLSEQITVLKSLTIKSKKIRPTRSAALGNKHHNAASIYADSTAAGSAMALLIENKYPASHPELTLPCYITKARLRIAHNTFDNFKVRVRFLAVDSLTGLPGEDLVDESIIITSRMRKGWLEVDLTERRIRINTIPFYIAFEWLIDDEDRLILLEQYQEFKRQFPGKVTVDTIVVDGEKIAFNSWHGFRAGTSFGSSSKRVALDNYKSYYRNNSYGTWKRASFVLTASVTVSHYNYPMR